MKIQNTLLSDYTELGLIPSNFTDSYVRDMFFSHYPQSGGIVGRRLIYKIMYKGKIVGIIGLQDVAVITTKVVKYLYGFSKSDMYVKRVYYNEVFNNNIFRLEINDRNLASRVLSMFRKRAYKDMQEKYGIKMRALITLTYGLNEKGVERTGKCYIADNWKFIGKTKGLRIHHDYGRDESGRVKWNVVQDNEQKSFYIYDFKKGKR